MEKYKRLEILINLLERRPYHSKEQILDYFAVHHEFQISARTLERDFKVLETEFHIPVIYDRTNRDYYLSKKDSKQITVFLQFAGRLYLADLFRKGLKDFKDLQKTIKLEDQSEFEGIHYVEPIFLAIRQNRSIKFVHYNYFRKSYTDYHIAPIQLREFKRRWYVIGVPLNAENQPEKNAHIKTFGLARLSKLKTLEITTIKNDKFENQLNKFNKIIGLNYDEGEKQEDIEIAVTPNQYKYLESLPLHFSQVYLGKLPDGRIKINLHLIPNYELKMQLLKLGDQIEVLNPKSLRKEMKKTINNTLKQYQ
ncbi:MAG TPA: WYL domain-containing protein [Flavobacteriaceae bacterium]|nr:WYL domain-containing protein [Flavobacteriaceae bacterium]